MLDAVIVSDLHYGDKRCDLGAVTGLFGHIGTVKHLIIAGDMLDSWCAKTWDMEFIRNLLMSVKFERCTVLRGNHDPDNMADLLGESFSVCDSTTIETNNGIYAVIHGHKYDDLLNQYSILARWGSKLQQYFYKQWGWDFQRIFRISLAKRNKTSYFKRVVTDVIGKMRTDFKDYRGVICGHTHYPVCVHYGNSFSYVNCGDLLESFSYVGVEQDGSVNLCGYFPTINQ